MNTAVLRGTMGNGSKGMLSDATIDRLSRWGPAWLLVFVMIGGIGYGVWSIGNRLVPALTSYVTASRDIDQQNSKHVALLVSAQEMTSVEHKSMLAGMKTLQTAIEERHQEHEEQTASIAKMLALIESAVEEMSVVPEQREEQLKLLQQIKAGIEELRTAVAHNENAP